ncbi:MAG: hypothetical protein K2I96_15725 [Lachnospiraceae bacterium]|nr:hypothetical protein [Lachnospiraceae bacterium]
MSNLQAMVKTELIGKDLSVMVQKVNDIICYAIIPNVLEEYSGLGLDEAIDQIGDFVKNITKRPEAPFTAKSIQDTIGELIDLKNVSLVLRQAYLFKISDKQKEDNNITEYAFNIAVNFEDGEPGEKKGSLFKVRELSFAVWSCDRQAILDTMDIVDLSDIDKAIENAARLAEKKKAVLQLPAAEKPEETAAEKESAAEEAPAAEESKAKEPAAEA